MVNKIIPLVLFLPCICFSQNRLFEKSMSRYEANVNASLNGDLSLYGTYTLNEYIKPLLAVDLHTEGGNYNVAPSLGVMFLSAEERFAPYARFQAGPNFSFSKGSSPGLFFNAAGGFQYALTNSTGINLELYYRKIKYSRSSILTSEYNHPTLGTYYSYTSPEVSANYLGLAFGLNYRFGSESKPKNKITNTIGKEKSFFDKVDLTMAATMNISDRNDGAARLGYNIFGTYAMNDNFRFGGGFEYSRESLRKYYSAYLTGLIQTSSTKLPIYTRVSAGANFTDRFSSSPGLMLSIAAGIKYNFSDRFGIILEAAYKNMHYKFGPGMYSYPDNSRTTFHTAYNDIQSMLGFSIGISIRLGK